MTDRHRLFVTTENDLEASELATIVERAEFPSSDSRAGTLGGASEIVLVVAGLRAFTAVVQLLDTYLQLRRRSLRVRTQEGDEIVLSPAMDQEEVQGLLSSIAPGAAADA